jgi:cyclopropane fatty-acyl-phospholipid synthase-like methyltransferase
MRAWWKRWKFEWLYLCGKPAWETGISPPELLEYLSHHLPGKALDLGCGTGTNVITMAKAGWQVWGVDFSRRAIRIARKKIQREGVQAEVMVENVTNLSRLAEQFDLILDIGCFHQLERVEREKYLLNIRRLLNNRGDLLMYAHYRRSPTDTHGIDESDLEQFLSFLRLVRRTEGWERQICPSAWLWFIKDADS